MATKQTEMARNAQVANYRKKIDLVFHDLPDEFTATELCKKAGIKVCFFERPKLATILFSVYKCTNYTGFWKKPKQSHVS